MQNYISLLEEELEDAKRRYRNAENEGKPVIAYQIHQIKRDIQRNSKNERVY